MEIKHRASRLSMAVSPGSSTPEAEGGASGGRKASGYFEGV